MPRCLYILCYDVCAPARLRRVFRLVRAYRVAGQKSAVECWLTEGERDALMRDIAGIIDQRRDRVHLFALDPRSGIRCLGAAASFTGPPFLVS